ncbi:TPA: hypothetical protein ACPZN8_004331 [Yersinia enterocolitica]
MLVVPPGLRIFRWGGKLLASRVRAERFHPGRERRRHALGHVASLRRWAAHHAGKPSLSGEWLYVSSGCAEF